MDYVLGLDGGGTKTECVLMDPAGKILARSFSGPSNPWRVGVESATREIEKAADLSFEEAQVARNVIVALGAGLAGTGNPELKERMHASLRGAFPGAAVSIFTDLEIALAAAGEGPVIVLVAGTGSAAIGRNAQGQIWRTGGQGPRFGDDGSAFDIGSRAVARAMKERDQHGKDSILGMKILEQLDYASWPELQERATLQPVARRAGGCATRSSRQAGHVRSSTPSPVGKQDPPVSSSRGGGAAHAFSQELASDAGPCLSSAHGVPPHPAPSPRPLLHGP